MAESYFPMNSVSGDRKYKAEDWAAYFAKFLGTGVYWSDSTQLAVVPGDGMSVIVKAGAAIIAGRLYTLSADKTIALNDADGVLDRIDRIVVQCDYTNRIIISTEKVGTASAVPSVQDVQRDADIYEIALADISVVNGAVTITDADITDQRLNNEVCGIVTGLIDQADSTYLFAQVEAMIESLRVELAAVTEGSAWMLSSVYAGQKSGYVANAEHADSATNGIQTYTHTTTTDDDGNVTHTLTGAGENGKFKATASGTMTSAQSGTTDNYTTCTIVQGDSTELEVTEGRWYSFILDEDASTINFSSGGVALNYKIVASATEPENPKENTFWVESDVAIGQCYISGNTPTENIEEGDVWLQIDYSAAASIYGTLDLLDDGTVLLEISIAWQYVDEAWVQKPLYMWDGETWISGVLRLFIYDNDGVNDTGGTWGGISGVAHNTFRVTPDLYGSPTSRSDRASNGGVYLDAMIDFTNYNTLTLDKGSSTSGYVMRLITDTDSLTDNLVSSRTAYSWTLTSTADEYTFDVSDIVGTYGLCFTISRATSASGNAPITIYNITLST